MKVASCVDPFDVRHAVLEVKPGRALLILFVCSGWVLPPEGEVWAPAVSDTEELGCEECRSALGANG